MSERIIELEIFIKFQTDRAILVEDLKGKDVWIAKSHLEPDEPFENRKKITLQIPEWLAIDKELV